MGVQVDIAAAEQHTGGACESCACYWTGDKRRASFLGKREAVVYGRTPRSILQDLVSSGKVRTDDHAEAQEKNHMKGGSC